MNILFYEFYKMAVFVKLLSISYIGIKGASSENNPYINLNVSTLQHLDWVRVTFGGISLSSTDGAWLGVLDGIIVGILVKGDIGLVSVPTELGVDVGR